MRVILGSVQAVAQSEVHGQIRPHLDRVLGVSFEVVIMQDLVRLGRAFCVDVGVAEQHVSQGVARGVTVKGEVAVLVVCAAIVLTLSLPGQQPSEPEAMPPSYPGNVVREFVVDVSVAERPVQRDSPVATLPEVDVGNAIVGVVLGVGGIEVGDVES